ncbi:hypothetical protein GALMADRAFT_46025, partial [Galerina marginata CBS 339.88]
PSRLRGDRGGENVELSVWMILKRGPNRASFMWGSSTHNTRIERLWVEVGRSFGRAWRAFFTRLGRLHRLDKSNPNHLWLLHYLFLQSIQKDCEDFQENWNAHPISGPGTKDRSPNRIRFEGQTTGGVYVEDEFDSVHPAVLQQYLGTTRNGVVRRRHQTGAGNPEEEEDSGDEDNSDEEVEIPEDLGERLVADQEGHIVHPAVPVPSKSCPFGVAGLALFETLFSQVTDQVIIPPGYGIKEEEWDDGEYPSVETLRTGKKRKELSVSLPDSIWRPRGERWVQGLACMTHILYELEENHTSSAFRIQIMDDAPPPPKKKKGTGYCTAILEGGKPCLCKEYDDPDEKTPGIPVVCQECCHGRSLHDGTAPKGVTNIFKQIISGSGQDALAAARKETNASLSGKSAVKHEKPKKSASGGSKKASHRVGNIVFITCGLTKGGKLQEKIAPDKHAIQLLESQKLAITYGSNQTNLEFFEDWGIKKMNKFLQNLFPKLFELFVAECPWMSSLDDDDNIPLGSDLKFPYVLLSKHYSELRVVPSEDFTGIRASQNRGRAGSSVKETFLWIG